MNRADARLAFVIVSTAIVASVVTAIVARVIAEPEDPRAPDPRVAALEQRVTALEHIAPAEAPPPPDPCDGVACVVGDYESACCKRFDKRAEDLDRAAISEAIAAVRTRVTACGDHTAAKGTVRLSVRVTPDGDIASIRATESPDPALAACVTAAVRGAHFRRTQHGGAFAYPFLF